MGHSRTRVIRIKLVGRLKHRSSLLNHMMNSPLSRYTFLGDPLMRAYVGSFAAVRVRSGGSFE